jgi:DeoR/GlpR family transcriptional regulator of sugar metabolism
MDTLNKFGVGVSGLGLESIVVLLNPARVMSKQDALNLAAWLVVLADEADEVGESKFDKLRAAISNT